MALFKSVLTGVDFDVVTEVNSGAEFDEWKVLAVAVNASPLPSRAAGFA